MKFILKSLLFLAVVGFVALTGFAYLGDLAPEQSEVSRSVVLNVQ